jgi:hypothetical protein
MVIRENVTEKTPFEKIIWKHLAFLYWTEGYLGYSRGAENQYPQVFDGSMSHAGRDAAAVILLVRR